MNRGGDVVSFLVTAAAVAGRALEGEDGGVCTAAVGERGLLRRGERTRNEAVYTERSRDSATRVLEPRLAGVVDTYTLVRRRRSGVFRGLEGSRGAVAVKLETIDVVTFETGTREDAFALFGRTRRAVLGVSTVCFEIGSGGPSLTCSSSDNVFTMLLSCETRLARAVASGARPAPGSKANGIGAFPISTRVGDRRPDGTMASLDEYF
jgi:hypothetical protein